jgi:ketosteroid isomerase-like protein
MTQAGTHTEQSVLARAAEWAAAERASDAAALEQILAPQFVGVGPFGFLLTREQWLARYRSGDLQTTALSLDETSVRLFGETAILIGRQTSTAAYRGQPTGGQFRTTLIFVSQGDTWLLAGLQYSAIAPPPG